MQDQTEYKAAQDIAVALSEMHQVAQIHKIVQALGHEQAHKLLLRTLEVERNGGMMVANGSRRRAVGGVFFHLAYTTGLLPNGKPFKRYGMMQELAQLYATQGKYEQAEQLYQQLLTINEERRFGWQQENTLLRLNDLVEFYQARKNYEQAQSFGQRALVSAGWVGKGHPQALRAYHNYDLVLQAISQEEAAKRKIRNKLAAFLDFLLGR